MKDHELGSILERIMAKAEEATGKTRTQLLAEAAEETSDPFEQEKADRAILRSRRIPDVHLQHVFDEEPDDTQALNEVKNWLIIRKPFLVLLGNVGVGKSAAACWALCHRTGGYFARAREFQRLAMAREDDVKNIWHQLHACPLAVLDQIGTEYDGDKGWFVNAFQGLIDARYEDNLRTIITSDLNAERFAEKYGPRVVDRLRESGIVVECGGESRRGI